MVMMSSGSYPIGSSTSWLTDTLFGDVAVTLGTLAVAFVGLTMLTGRLPIRHGAMVILGTFVLLGAPAIAASLIDLARQSGGPAEPPYIAPEDTDLAPREELPAATYNPYAGASMRRGYADSQN